MSYVFEKLKKPIVGYKKVSGRLGRQVITLIIPAGAMVGYVADYEDGSIPWDKCKFRANRAYVAKGSGASLWAPSFKYVEGRLVKPRYPYSIWDRECGSGIHFYISPDEARKH